MEDEHISTNEYEIIDEAEGDYQNFLHAQRQTADADKLRAKHEKNAISYTVLYSSHSQPKRLGCLASFLWLLALSVSFIAALFILGWLIALAFIIMLVAAIIIWIKKYFK